MPLTRVYHTQKPSFWQRQHANLACCREPNLIFALLTAQRIFAIKTRRTKPPAAISQDYLLGGCAFGASGILFIAEATATRKSCVLPRAKLDFCFSTAHHCSNGITVKSIAPYVIPRSETTWESPKKKREHFWRLTNTAFVLAISTAQRICAISSNKGKNSRHSCAKLSAWWKSGGTPTPDITVAENFSLFEAFLYTVCATSKTEHEPQGGEKSERRA